MNEELGVCCSYVRPEIVGDGEQPLLVIRGGRHPVLAAMLTEAQVVPNDTLLGGTTGPRACIITGPNMGYGSETLMGALEAH